MRSKRISSSFKLVGILFLSGAQFGLIVLALEVCVVAAASNSVKGDFIVRKWTTEEGLPQNTVTSMVQTEHGYIWLGTFGGLARFDGVTFKIFDSTNAPGLRSNRILSLYEDRWKRLWIGTEAGEVYTLADGNFIEFQSVPDFKRTVVWQFLEDDNGRLFIASDAGLERVEFGQDGSVIPDSIKVLSRQRAFQLAKGPGNTIWTSNGKAFILQGEQLVRADTLGLRIPKDIISLDFSNDGRMLVGTVSSFGWFENGKFSDIETTSSKDKLAGCTPAFRSTELWCQKGSKLHEFKDGNIVTYDLNEFVTDGTRQLFFDRSGNIWLATQSDGLICLSPRKISLVGDMTDLDVWARYAVAEDSERGVWLAGHNLLRVRNGKVQKIDMNPAAPGELITSLAVDRNGVIWAGGAAALYTIKNGRLLKIPGFIPGRTHSLYFDKNAAL
ncbi:MAG TPA: hypothetical protein DDW24_13270, partial [Blastocatellia bacterium]|nr:hypothetical protein [Blastocatellia bacterium]